VRIAAPLTPQADCPIGWKDPAFAEALHIAFTGALGKGEQGVFHCPDLKISGSRFSINCIGFFGRTVARLDADFSPPEVDDEEWISAVLPSKTQRTGLVVGDLLAAHFAFFTQEDYLSRRTLLGLYAALAAAPNAQAPRLAAPRAL